MFQIGPSSADFPSTAAATDATDDDAAAADADGWEPGPETPPELADLLAENARLREENHALRAQSFEDRQKAHYYQDLHQRAKERLAERDQKIAALKAKLADLQHRLFGRKSERRQQNKSARESMKKTPKRPRGQQPGTAGHGRKPRTALPVIEVELHLPAAQTICACCGKPWEPWGEPEVSEQIEWEVRLFRRRTKRTKYRRPKGCTCPDGRPEIVSAPPPPALIPKGLLAISFIVQVLLLKYLYSTPLHRILAMARSAGMPLSAGTLCGVLKTIAPLFIPLYEAIYARSRQEDLALMDETRWAVFTEVEGKSSHRWWLWVVVTSVTRLYLLSPSRSGATPKKYFGYDAHTESVTWHKQVMVDRYKAYEFLQDLLLLAYCWAHVRRDFLEARRDVKDREWADAWVEQIGQLYCLNKARLELACALTPTRELPAPFVELDPERMAAPADQKADTLLGRAVEKMAAASQAELADKDLRRPRRKILKSLENHWHGLILFVAHPQIPMDNNGSERAARQGATARKNFYGSGAKWSGELLVMLFTLFQTLLLYKINLRAYLTAYLQACADNGASAPADLSRWLPWNFSTPAPGPEAAAGAAIDLAQPEARAP
jgi:transposase